MSNNQSQPGEGREVSEHGNCVHQTCPRPTDCHYYCMDRHAMTCVAAANRHHQQQDGKCEHGVSWSMECLSCGHSDYVRADLLQQPTSERAATGAGEGEGRDGVAVIAAERRRHFEVEGWTPEHDDNHTLGEMAVAAACYAVAHTDAKVSYPDDDPEGSGWPWGTEWFKPKDDVRNLARAGALIAAEIDRLRRAATPPAPSAAAPQEQFERDFPEWQDKMKAAKSQLAHKVLAAIPEVGVTWDSDGYETWIGAPDYRESVVGAIKRVLVEAGVEVDTKGGNAK